MTAPGRSDEAGRDAPGLSLLKVLGRRWFAVVISVFAFGAIGLVVSKQLTPTYQSSAKIFLNSSEEALGGGSVDPTRVVQTQAEFAASTQVVTTIAQQLQVSNLYVADRLTTVPAEEGYFFEIVGTDDTQAKANQLVTAAKDQYVKLSSTFGSSNDANLAALRKSRDDLAAEQAPLAAARATGTPVLTPQQTARLKELDTLIPLLDDDIVTAQRQAAGVAATVALAEDARDDGQTSPNLFVNALLGALFGLLASAAVIWSRYLRRPTVLDGRSAADALGAPLIAGPSSERANVELTTDVLVSAMAAVLSPTVKVVALTPAGAGDLAPETVAAVAAAWSDDQGVVLVVDASPTSDVRTVLERLPRATSGELPRWAHDPTCLARSSGTGRGHVLYNRVAPARAARPGGLAPILADRAPVVDLVILLTPPLADLPMTAASALQADAVVILTSPETRVNDLAQVSRDWPALAERIVGVVHDTRSGFRRSGGAAPAPRAGGSGGGALPPVVDPVDERRVPSPDPDATDRYLRPSTNKY